MYKVISINYNDDEQITELDNYEVVGVLEHRLKQRSARLLVSVPEDSEEYECGSQKADGTACERTVPRSGETCWQHS